MGEAGSRPTIRSTIIDEMSDTVCGRAAGGRECCDVLWQQFGVQQDNLVNCLECDIPGCVVHGRQPVKKITYRTVSEQHRVVSRRVVPGSLYADEQSVRNAIVSGHAMYCVRGRTQASTVHGQCLAGSSTFYLACVHCMSSYGIRIPERTNGGASMCKLREGPPWERESGGARGAVDLLPCLAGTGVNVSLAPHPRVRVTGCISRMRYARDRSESLEKVSRRDAVCG